MTAHAAIFTEGGGKRGWGHISRCGALAQAFENYQIHAHLLIDGDASVLQATPSGISVELLNWKYEKILKERAPVEFAVIDSYEAPERLYQIAYETADTVIFFDDYSRIEYPGGLLIDNAETPAKENSNIVRLSGLEYLPLRKGFWDAEEKKINEQIRSVVVNLGGGDTHLHTLQTIVDIAGMALPEIEIHILGGARGLSLAGENIHMQCGLSDKELAKLFSQTDLAISAGGVTLNELAVCGVPTIAFTLADNQLNNIRSLVSLDLAGYAGAASSSAFREELIKQIESFHPFERRSDISRRLRSTVTGRGALNVVKKAFRHFLDKRLLLRKAGIQDEAATLRLSNDPETRASSFNQDVIRPEVHAQWFRQKIADPKTLFMIAEVKNRFAGQIRFETEGENAVISVSVEKDFRNLGTGRVMMSKAIEECKRRFPHIRRAKAYMRKENKRSEMFFRRSGFKFVQELEIKGIPALEYILEL